MTRALDALVADRVMGWYVYFSEEVFVNKERCSLNDWGGREGAWSDLDLVPPYSTDITAAWEVVKKLVETDDGWEISINSMWAGGQDKMYFAQFYDSLIATPASRREQLKTRAGATKLPLAICLAALKSVGVPREEIYKALEVEGCHKS